jgi:hypothetical protein
VTMLTRQDVSGGTKDSPEIIFPTLESFALGRTSFLSGG